MNYKAFTIELSRNRGQWRFRLRKPGGATFRMRGDPMEISEWVSSPYMEKDWAIEQAKLLIDSGGVE